MSGVFTAIIPDTAVSAAVDLMEIVGHATKPFVILELHLHQTTEVGEAQEEQLLIALKSGQTTSGSGGNAATNANPTDTAGGTSGFTFKTLNTTKASAGTIVTHKTWAWQVRGPFDVIDTELSQCIMSAARRCTLELVNAPGDSITIGGYAVIQEIG